MKTFLIAICLLFCSCQSSQINQINKNLKAVKLVVSIKDQKASILDAKTYRPIKRFTVSTGRAGIGNKPRSNATPIGSFQVIKEIGEGYSPDITIKGDSVISYTITRSKIDPIISRSIWIDGLDPQNNNTLNRTIRMHGSPFVDKLGIPCSMGCVRFAPEDIMVVCNYLKLGDIIEIQR